MSTEPCDIRCGYVSEGLDLLQHMRFEHVRCTECGNEPIGVSSVSHKPDCPRLRPGYVYPPFDGGGDPKDAAPAVAGEKE